MAQVSGACFPLMGAFVLVDALSALMQGDKDGFGGRVQRSPRMDEKANRSVL